MCEGAACAVAGVGNNKFSAGAVANYCQETFNGTDMHPTKGANTCTGRRLDVWAKIYVTTIAARPSQLGGVTHKNVKYGCWKCRRCRNKAIVLIVFTVPIALYILLRLWLETIKPGISAKLAKRKK
jgi:hypothetical protein